METTRIATLRRIARESVAKRANRAYEEGADSGFTLIELMVVLLILAILLAIAIPTFLGVTKSAHDRAAQSDLTNALTSAKASFVNGQAYQATTTLEASSLNTSEPSLNFKTNTFAAVQGDISVGVYEQTVGSGNWTTVVLAAWSPSTNNCWWAADVENTAPATLPGGGQVKAGTNYSKSTPATDAGCNASVAADVPALGTWLHTYPSA